MRIVIDSREKKPYRFAGAIKKSLNVGDYSIEGLEDEVAIERKSLNDWVQCCIGKNRERLEREIERSKSLNFFAIIIESDVESIWKARLWSKIPRSAIINTALAWQVKHGIPIIFVSKRSYGKKAVETLLKSYVKYKNKITLCNSALLF